MTMFDASLPRAARLVTAEALLDKIHIQQDVIKNRALRDGVDVYSMMTPDGNYLYIPLLLAEAQVLDLIDRLDS